MNGRLPLYALLISFAWVWGEMPLLERPASAAELTLGSVQANTALNVGGFTIEFWNPDAGAAWVTGFPELVQPERMRTWTEDEQNAIIRAFEYWSDTLQLPAATSSAPFIRVIQLQAGESLGPTDNHPDSLNAAAASVTMSTDGTYRTNTYAKLVEGLSPTPDHGLDGSLVFRPGSGAHTFDTQSFGQLLPQANSMESIAIHEVAHLLGFARLDLSSPDIYSAHVNDGVFHGSHAEAVYPGGVPVNDIPVTPTDIGHIGHTMLEFHNMTRADPFGIKFRNIPYFAPAELAILKDLGYDGIDLQNHFGTAVYQATPNAATTMSASFSSSTDFAVGAFLYADRHDLSVVGDISLTGNGAAGIRVAGRSDQITNTVTIGPTSTISVSGQDGIGVLVSSGAATYLVHRGTINADGIGGIGILADFGPAYFSKEGVVNSSSRPFEQPLIYKLDVTGQIIAQNGAGNVIEIRQSAGPGAEINIMSGASLDGNIVSHGLGALTFGKSNIDGKSPDWGSDPSFNFTFGGNIGGATPMVAEFAGGTTTFSGGEIRFGDVFVHPNTSVRVLDGAEMKSDQLLVLSFGDVAVTVSGQGSSLAADYLEVGRSIVVENRGLLQGGFAAIGSGATAHVVGAGSVWQLTDTLIVDAADLGSFSLGPGGTLSVRAGGMVQAPIVLSSGGIFFIEGPGSTLQVTNAMRPNGQVYVRNGGRILLGGKLSLPAADSPEYPLYTHGEMTIESEGLLTAEEVEVDGGILNIQGGAMNSPLVRVNYGGQFNISENGYAEVGQSLQIGGAQGPGTVNLSEGGKLFATSLEIDGGELDMSGSLVEVGNVSLLGGGAVRLRAGETTVAESLVIGQGGTIELEQGATLTTNHFDFASGTFNFTGGTLNAAGTVTGAVVVPDGGLVKGTGTFTNLTVGSGGSVSPGNSPEGMVSLVTEWGAGGNYLWEVSALMGNGGSEGSDPGWDFWDVGELLVSATVDNPFNVVLNSLTPLNAPGALIDWDASLAQSWHIASGEAGTFLAGVLDLLAVDATPFSLFNDLDGGTFSLTSANDAADLLLTFNPLASTGGGGGAVPEPNTGLLIFGLVLLTWNATRRRPLARPW